MQNDLLRILRGSVVTEKNNKVYYLDLYTKNNKTVDYSELVDTLINIDFIEFESGNWETRERHYIVNTKYVSHKDGIRHVKLKKFIKQLNNYSEMIVSDSVKDAFNLIKKRTERKQKLEKLYEK